MSSELASGIRNTTPYQAILLGGFATLAAALLVVSNLVTREPIEQRRREDLMASLSQVIPARLHDNDLLADVIKMRDGDSTRITYRGVLDGRVTAVAYQVTGYGYAGAIEILMGVDANGEILGVRVLSHAETPGLGDKIEPAKDDWILGFNGLSRNHPPASAWAVKKDGGHFDQFSGATITPRAVVKAVKSGLDFFYDHKTRLLGYQSPAAGGPEE